MPTYYPIDETAARRAKEMSSFYDYKPGCKGTRYLRNRDTTGLTGEAKENP